jgi:hypothetical protein
VLSRAEALRLWLQQQTPDHGQVFGLWRDRPQDSLELQQVLYRMRWSGVGQRHVLLMLEPGRRWMLAQLPARRGEPLKTFPEQVFTSIADAEWTVFCLRWELLTGESISNLNLD